MQKFNRDRLNPSCLIVALVALQVVFWTVAPTITHTAPPLDVVESGMWGREGIVLSFKHPNLPGLLIEATHRLTGVYGWPQYLLSATFVGVTYWLVYLLGVDLMGASAAAAGTLLLVGCYYFSWPTPEFNHNVAQMPLWAAFSLLLWRAVRQGQDWCWLALGAIAALALYAKFSSGLIIFSGTVWVFVDAEARGKLRRRWPWIGLAVFALVTAPLAIDVARLHFSSIAWVGQSSGGKPNLVSFVTAQIADVAAMIVVAALAFFWPRRSSAETNLGKAWDLKLAPGAGTFLLILGLLPIGLTVGMAAITGAKDMWAATMFDLFGLLVVYLLRGKFRASVLSAITAVMLPLCVLIPTIYGASLVIARSNGQSVAPRALWPQAAISERMLQIWQKTTSAPLQIVAGNDWVAGLVALTAPSSPSIFVDLDTFKSPWVTISDLTKKGGLIVWQTGAKEPPPYTAAFSAAAHGTEDFIWSLRSKPISISYLLVSPK